MRPADVQQYFLSWTRRDRFRRKIAAGNVGDNCDESHAPTNEACDEKPSKVELVNIRRVNQPKRLHDNRNNRDDSQKKRNFVHHA